MPLIIPGNSQASTGYTIDQSIRFNDNDSAFMKKDYSGDGSQTTFTLSGWFKLGILTGSAHSLFATGYLNGSAADFSLYFSGDQLYFFGGYNGGTPANKLETTQLFRDHSAWYHIVFVADTTNAVSVERLRLYVNGSRVTAFDTETYPSQNNTLVWGDATYSHAIGASGDDTTSLNSQTPRFHYDGYMAEIHYLDGYAYDPSFFGEFNDSGIWIPKEYTGSYGSNGFKIDGRDSSDLGDDESGNGNDFTSNNLTASDQVLDSPTNNFAVMNPLADYYANHTFKNGNLELLTSTTTNQYTYSINNIGMSSGKWYAEMYVGSIAGQCLIGISDRQSQGGTHYLGSQSYEYSWYSYNGKSINGGTQSTFASTYTTNDIIGVALDLDNSKLYFSKNGSFVNSGDPTSGSTGTGAISITAVGSTQNDHYFFAVGDYSNSGQITVYWNFGQEGTFAGNTTAGGNSDGNGVGNFKYSVPSGYLALCTKNLGS